MLDFLLNALKWYGIVVGSVFGFMIAFVVVMLLVLSISIRAASPRQVIVVVREQGGREDPEEGEASENAISCHAGN